MTEKDLVCIICPNSCKLTVRSGEVSGNTCKRGKDFALQELAAPLRVLTTTIRYRSGTRQGVVPVKSSSAIPFAEFRAVIAAVKRTILSKQPEHGARLTIDCGISRVELIVTGY